MRRDIRATQNEGGDFEQKTLLLFFCYFVLLLWAGGGVVVKIIFHLKSLSMRGVFSWLEKEGGERCYLCICHLFSFFSFFLSLHLPAPRAQTSKKYIHIIKSDCIPVLLLER